MLRCKKCNQLTARVTTKRELRELSKKLGPVAAAVATAATAAAAKAGPGALGFALRAAKAAPKDPKALLIGAAITAGTAAVGLGVKYLFGRVAANDKTYAYCTSCGHYEAMN